MRKPSTAVRRLPLRTGAVLTLTSALFAAALTGAAPAAAAPVSAPAEARTRPAPGQLVLPAPTGSARIGTVALHLVDSSRRDPWARSRQAREIMLQIWYPARDTPRHPRAPWLSPGLADLVNPPGSPLILPTTHAHTGAPLDQRAGARPVLLYSHGFGGHRSETTALVEELASRGYVVVTIDHTHNAAAVEFPDGRLVTNAIEPPDFDDPADPAATKAVAVRAADTRFVLDQLAALNAGRNPDAAGRPLPPGLRGALALSRVGMFGHSLGGATTLAAMHADPRIRAGVNADGAIFGPVVGAGLDRPVLLLGSEGHNRHTDPTWAALWQRLRGWRLNLELAGSAHASFTDAQVLDPQAARVLGIPPGQLVPNIGTIDPKRSVAVQRAYLRAFFDRHLGRGDGRLLGGASPRYPQMRFVGGTP